MCSDEQTRDNFMFDRCVLLVEELSDDDGKRCGRVVGRMTWGGGLCAYLLFIPPSLLQARP